MVQLLKSKYKCRQCGKQEYKFNVGKASAICKSMLEEKLCWECAYWGDFLSNPPQNLEVIGNRCYQIFPFVETPWPEQILGGNKTMYLLKKSGECLKTNDVWWLNTIPWKYQDALPVTAWWVSKAFFESMQRSRHRCKARGCLDRYHCYRYQYRLEFDKEPYNYVPKDWIVGDERCPAFLPLKDIECYDEYVKASDIIDESSLHS